MGWGQYVEANESLSGVEAGGVVPYMEQPITLLSEELTMRIKKAEDGEQEAQIERSSFLENTSNAPYTLSLFIPEYAYGTGKRAQIRNLSLLVNGQKEKVYYRGNPTETYTSPTALLPYTRGGYTTTLQFLPKERKHLILGYAYWGVVERGTEQSHLAFSQALGVEGWKGKPKRWKATILLEDTSLYDIEELSPRAWPWETDEERKRVEVVFDTYTVPNAPELTVRVGEGHKAFGRRYCLPGKVSSPNEGTVCAVLDNDRGTSWNTPWTGSGVTFTLHHLPEGRWYEEVTILPSGSYVEEGGKWQDHGRPKEIELYFIQNEKIVYSFLSTMGDERVGNTIRFPEGVPVHRGSAMEVKMHIKDSYPGNRFSDLGISEVQFHGLPLHMVEGREKEPSFLERPRAWGFPLSWFVLWRNWMEEIALIWS